MLIVFENGQKRTELATLLLEPKEALELIEKLSYLLRRPEWHHDHLEYEGVVLDVAVIYPDNIDSFHQSLQPLIRAYFARQSSK